MLSGNSVQRNAAPSDINELSAALTGFHEKDIDVKAYLRKLNKHRRDAVRQIASQTRTESSGRKMLIVTAVDQVIEILILLILVRKACPELTDVLPAGTRTEKVSAKGFANAILSSIS